MALALLTVLLRHQDGWEITLAEIGAKYGYGRDALARAMGLLQVARYVVKVRIMSAADNQWATDVVVFDTPASDSEVAQLLEDTARDPEVRAVQLIEPTKSALEEAAKRREKLSGPKRRRRPSASVPSRDTASAGDGGTDGARPGPVGGGEAGGAAAAKPKQPRKAAGSTPKPGRRLSKEQAAAVRAVEGAFPEELRELLPKYRPEVLRDAILQALESRTTEQLAERVRRRWWAHGYAADAMPEGKGIGSPVGVAVGLVRPSTDCPDPMCEDGTTVDTGAACRACAERRAGRKADRRGRVPEQRTEPGQVATNRWECAECRDPYKGDRPADGLCSGCRAEAEAAAAAARRLREEFDHAEAERARLAAEAWDAMLEEAYAEHGEREQAAAALRAEREASEQRRRADEEETHRLREQLAEEYPELAALSQS